MEINLLLTLDLREQAALQSALVTHGAPDALVTLALTGACRISSAAEARRLKEWLSEARTAGEYRFRGSPGDRAGFRDLWFVINCLAAVGKSNAGDPTGLWLRQDPVRLR